MTLALVSNAKINIGLRIVGRREDGYHLLHTLFQEIDFSDKLTIASLPTPEITLTVTGPAGKALPADADNLCVQAAQLLQRKAGVRKGARIHLEKYIPAGAGLGGGSSNAATVLKGLSQLWEINLADQELEAMAVALGADVPFFIHGGLQLGEGIGEVLTPLDRKLKYSILLVVPPARINTAWAYNQLAGQMGQTSDEGLDKLIEQQPIPWEKFSNDFDHIIFAQHPQLRAIKEDLVNEGAEYASLSGSGSAVYGLFTDSSLAERVKPVISDGKTILAKPLASREA